MIDFPKHRITVEITEKGDLFERLRANLGENLPTDLARDLGVSPDIPWVLIEWGGEMKKRGEPVLLEVALQRAFTPAELNEYSKMREKLK